MHVFDAVFSSFFDAYSRKPEVSSLKTTLWIWIFVGNFSENGWCNSNFEMLLPLSVGRKGIFIYPIQYYGSCLLNDSVQRWQHLLQCFRKQNLLKPFESRMIHKNGIFI